MTGTRALRGWACGMFLSCIALAWAMAGPAWAQTSGDVQSSQNSIGNAAGSGTAAGANNSSWSSGTSADGTVVGQAQSRGDASAHMRQDADAGSGDTVAGSQETGVAADRVRVQNQNATAVNRSLSGDAAAANESHLSVGTEASGDLVAQDQSDGGSTLGSAQTAMAETGDAVAGSQVTGTTGLGAHQIGVQNVSLDSQSASGAAVALNHVDEDISDTDIATRAIVITHPPADFEDSYATQIGVAESGDAVAGSQVNGVNAGSATVQGSNTSIVDAGVSGPAAVANTALADVPLVGQSADAASGDAVAGSQLSGVNSRTDASVDQQAFALLARALTGDAAVLNAADVEPGNGIILQRGVATSGDAIGGSQVVGVIATGRARVSNMLNSFLPFAVSGTVAGLNDVVAQFGDSETDEPVSQFGDTEGAVFQEIVTGSGDAVSGGQSVGVVNRA